MSVECDEHSDWEMQEGQWALVGCWPISNGLGWGTGVTWLSFT